MNKLIDYIRGEYCPISIVTNVAHEFLDIMDKKGCDEITLRNGVVMDRYAITVALEVLEKGVEEAQRILDNDNKGHIIVIP